VSGAVRCEFCQQRFAAAPHLYGTRVACPRCGGAIDVPSGPLANPLDRAAGPGPAPRVARPAAAVRPVGTLRTRAQARRPARPGPSRTVILWTAVGGGFAIVLIVGIVASSYLLGGGSKEAATIAGGGPAASVAGAPTETRPAERGVGQNPVESPRGAAGTKDSQTPGSPTTAAPGAAAPSSAAAGIAVPMPAQTTSHPPPAAPATSPAPQAPAVDPGPEDPEVSSRRVRECWEAYGQALERRDGKAAAACLDRETVGW
jgi:hypothetical protein